MTVKECYECLGADYEDVSCRLRSEERILKFLKMVLKDTSFKDLCNAMEEQDYEKAFRAVHTLKGVLPVSYTHLGKGGRNNGKNSGSRMSGRRKRPEKKGKSVFPGAGKASQQQNGNVRPGNFADSYRFGDSSAADHAL